jgi:hypothetical protein
MAEPEKLVLGDKSVFPSDEVLSSIIGDKTDILRSITGYVKEKYNNITEEWRYYNDGKQWLFKMQYKKKTIFWIGVLHDTFRITFYFGEKAEPVIVSSTLPEKMKDEFISGKRYGKIRAVSVRISGISDLEDVYKLIDLKVKML